MPKHTTPPLPAVFECQQGKGSANKPTKPEGFESQRRKIYQAWHTQLATMRMIEVQTGVLRPNICRLVRKMEKAKTAFRVYQAFCRITGRKAWYFTTNPALTPHGNQTKLFN